MTTITQPNRLAPPILFALLWLATTLYIAAAPTRHYTPDAVNNLQFIEDGSIFELWHSQHLLAQWGGYWLYQAGGGAFRAEFAMRAAHALLAGLAVALTYAAAQSLTGRAGIALLSGLALWFGYGFWHYASDPDIYMPGYVGGALLLWTYIRYLRVSSGGRMTALALAAALALLLHQLYIEMAGLIGLTLLWRAGRRGGGWRHVVGYAAACALIPLSVYFVGWLNVRAWLTAGGSAAPDFLAWALRYFGAASAGEATWGVSFSLSSLPVALYAWAQTWLPPLNRLSPLYGAALGLMGVGAALIARDVITRLFARRNHDERGDGVSAPVVFVCAGTLAANFVSGWWWQAGNLKFYLFMQVNLILLLAWYAVWDWRADGRDGSHPDDGAISGGRRLRRPYGLLLVLGGLALAHVGVTLPYEMRGGVFTVRGRFPDPSAQTIYFDDAWQGVILRYISAHQPRTLDADACGGALSPGAVWVVREAFAADCAALDGLEPLERYQARREGDWWLIYAAD